MLPLFVKDYKVPLVTIAEATAGTDRKILFFKNNRSKDGLSPYFSTDWVFNVGNGSMKAEHLYPDTAIKDLTGA